MHECGNVADFQKKNLRLIFVITESLKVAQRSDATDSRKIPLNSMIIVE